MTTIQGRVRRFGDNVNTDYVITSARKRETLDTSVLKQYLLETLDSAFAASVRGGDVIVAGRNFGCGSAMEIAATVILAAGIKAVLAESFSRTFYRNAINNGLLPVACDTSGMLEGHDVAIDVAGGEITVTNHSTGDRPSCEPIGGFLVRILEDGGLVPFIRRHQGQFVWM